MPASQPHQDEAADAGRDRPAVRWRPAACFRRSLLAALVIGQTAVATVALASIMPLESGYLPNLLLIGLFTLLHGWIAVGCWTAVFGFVIRRLGGDRYSLARRHTEESLCKTALAPTAIVVPICNEPVERTLSGLREVYRELQRQGRLKHFDFYILSDTRDPEVWLAEQAAWQALCRELKAEGRLFYRRRTVSLNYKSGNIADFLRRWGRRYRYMIVLDADSLAGGETLVRLVRLMEREPAVGIVQTSPIIVGAETLFARLQQFASRVYSPLFASGLAAIQMGDAVYWGHNAIIRVDAFMKHCGLRKLTGPGLFGGPVISHDFVEAAYMGRAGYEVWLEPSLAQSYEESPPTLEDELIRDHRWTRGNLQHLWLLMTTPALRFTHRMALVNGIMSYLASPLWLLFVILTMITAGHAPQPETTAPLPFAGGAALAVGLGLSTLGLLFLPRLLAIGDILVTGQSALFGGRLRLIASTLLETVVSLLLAPIKMLAHSRSVVCALTNVPVHWAGQNRQEETGWGRALDEHRTGIVLALGWCGVAGWIGSPLLALWSLPVILPLLVAAQTSVVLGTKSSGSAVDNAGLLATPESREPLQMIQEAGAGMPLLPGGIGLSNVQQAILLPTMNAVHRQLARVRPEKQTTAALIRHCLEHGPDQLEHRQLNLLCRDRQALASLHTAAWQADRDSYWGSRIASLIDYTRLSLGERLETTDRHHAPAQRPVRGAAASTLSLDTVDCG
ncbi:glucans biosynthesis glucosyltransferase MdoH [Marinobacter orientalis]|uniref:Glucans biosynthesis glucosyltransferase H n=1 Tax=Marinobacter orientalis TaxID=1928859 RepID=A0A7Y0NLN5_9GAMM|nr:glucans biosynthesis glucosyltransferase MdoH [Marinobacter orientalis]NMT62813.1 glucans biosynthesis glucosyltransferase MdoH [Marinobacter orientalis]TGX51491.1 glucans biosynthesis glucosyltransferase MdoH [Marinobacter orientalis]